MHFFSSTETAKCKFSLPHIQNKTTEQKIKKNTKKQIWNNKTKLEFNVLQQCQYNALTVDYILYMC